MGDRANFGLRQEDGNIIYVYGHWAGEGMLSRFANALVKAESRIPFDPAYSTRIIISQLIGEDWSGELGWGISINRMVDNEHKVPVYDFATDTVTLFNFDWYQGVTTDSIVEFTRDEFIAKYAKPLIGV